jgi:hypothetical protein
MHFVTITSARRPPGKLIDTRQNVQSIQPTFPETGILFYSTGALRRRNDENDLSADAFVTGSVARISTYSCIIGNAFLSHRANTSRAVMGSYFCRSFSWIHFSRHSNISSFNKILQTPLSTSRRDPKW